MTQTAGQPHEIAVHVSDVRNLFMPTEIDPFAESDEEALGEPALLPVLRKLMAAREMRGTHKLVVLVPPARIEPGLEARTRAAVQRYCRLKIEANDLTLRVMRREAAGLAVRGLLLLTFCMGMSSLLTSEAVRVMPELLQTTLGEGFNVVGWVMMWRPVEALFFNPLPVRTSTAAHRFVLSLQLEVRPDPDRSPSRA